MLTLETGPAAATCDGIARRDLLRIGTLGMGGALCGSFQEQAGASEAGNYVRDRSIILLFLAGGPSQHETFDPKPDGTGTSTSIAGHIATKIPGVRFASYFPKLAAMADRLTVVRSFQTHHAEHNGAHKQILTADLSVGDGKPIRHPGPGPVYARVAGAMHPRTGMPRNAIVPPTTRHLPVKAGFAGAFDSVVDGSQPASLGARYAPFEVRVPMAEGVAKPRKKRRKRGQPDVPENPLVANMTLRLNEKHLADRMQLLRRLDGVSRMADAIGEADRMPAYHRQALEMLRGGGLRNAIDLSREDAKTLAAYDTERYRNYRCNDNSKFERSGPSIGISLGRQLLMARRLCEAGCGFVTVIHANWDFHARKGIPNIPEGMSVLAPPLDHAVAAFLTDLEQRGLTDKIQLVITGEFGRTPKLDKNLGRHHWPKLCPLVFAGGKNNHGRIIGESDRRGGEPSRDAFSIDDFHATLIASQFDVGQMRLDASLPAEIQKRATKGKSILAHR